MFLFLNYLSFVFLKVHVLNIVKLKEENHTSSHFALHNRNYNFSFLILVMELKALEQV